MDKPPQRTDFLRIVMKNVCKTILMTCVVMLTASCTKRHEEPKTVELFHNGKPLGQPYTKEMADIRMVRVSSVNEADSLFTILSRNSDYGDVLSYCLPDGDSIRYSRNENTDGKMLYTHRTLIGTYEVGIIYIQDSAINNKGIREVHFVKTIKRN